MRSCRPLPVSLDASANLFAGLLALKPFAAACTPPSIRSNNAPEISRKRGTAIGKIERRMLGSNIHSESK